ncbi:MAG: histidine phosphatase family protein [Rhizobium sp.]
MKSGETNKGGGRQELRLILLRHAKSAWPDGVADKERPLAPRGLEAASLMGEYMAREGLLPDLVLVSTARRTQETWAIVKEALAAPVASRKVDELYAAPAERMLGVLRSVDPNYHSVMIVGHNPGTQDLARWLAGQDESDARQRLGEKYPTAGLAVFDFEAGDWHKLVKGAGRLERFVTPRSFA